MSDEESSSEWDSVETAKEAEVIVYKTVFEFANVILHLCEEEERVHPEKYKDNNIIRPSTKIKFITGLLKLLNSDRICIHYTNYVLNWAKYIEKRDVKVFLENDEIFPGAPKEDIEFFRNLWRPTSAFHLNRDQKEHVFEYFDTMIHYCREWKRISGFKAKWEE